MAFQDCSSEHNIVSNQCRLLTLLRTMMYTGVVRKPLIAAEMDAQAELERRNAGWPPLD